MKKIFVCLLAALLLTGCAAPKQDTPTQAPTETSVPETTVSEAAVPETAAGPQPTGKMVTPMASSVNLDNLEDCILPVGFTESTDVIMNDGRLEIRMDVYEQELFDLVDMAMLTPGDSMVIAGKAIFVETITEENGAKLINGGYENDGYTFFSNNCGGFYTITASDRLDYQKVGEVTLPVRQDFLLTDRSNLEEHITYPGDLITEAPNSTAIFHPYNTTAHIVDGWIESITAEYMG